MSILNKLTEGIVNRDLKKEGDALLSKWEKTGLLEGLENDTSKNGMARLLENQAKQLLKEASSMAAGDVEGFASVAFPLVRRVFGGLLANDLVSVQPMSLPSGLIFFLDFTYSNTHSGLTGAGTQSLYGGGAIASQITGGVSDITEDAGGFYNLSNHYSSPTGSSQALGAIQTDHTDDLGDLTVGQLGIGIFPVAGVTVANLTDAQKKCLRFDPDVLSATSTNEVFSLTYRFASAAAWGEVNENALGSMMITTAIDNGTEDTLGLTGGTLLRRLTEKGYRTTAGEIVKSGHSSHVDGEHYVTFYWMATSDSTIAVSDSNEAISYALKDDITTGGAVGSVVGQDAWGLEGADETARSGFNSMPTDIIPEIDIKVDSVAVTAMTKKLKAKWTPELGQDLNAYHNLDAEVELTSILSEQIALEIDKEILNDLVQGATAGTYYWSRAPGLFVNRQTGAELGAASAAPDFTGTVSEWYETLVETMNDVSAAIHRKTLRGGANFVVCGPEVANILEFTAGFRASVTADADRGTVGAVKSGSISKKWDVYVDPYFPRNVVLVGRKGGSFLESGYVYAPYVPLQVTPTIFGTEDFVPRKGVMTRYAKKMVRPDMYGVVIVRGLLGEEGSS